MENIINLLVSNKALLAVAVFISILIILSAARKLVRAAIVLLAILIIYAAYLIYSGQKVPRTGTEAIRHVTVKIDELKKSEVKIIKKAGD
ncbi:MAG: hypothetical protein JW807_09705 [Spirochaetes bacterium]|nr:hypothetical protein [Spirochaetota bacterium]